MDEVVIEVTNKDVILFKTTMGRVANVTLRQLGGNSDAVDTAQGQLDLEDCDVTSRGRVCVAIHGGADPRLRRNRIHDGMTGGVVVYEGGRGTLEDNEIFANAWRGVTVRTEGNPILRRNRINDNGEWAIWIYEGGGGTFEENDLRNNKKGAWNIAKDCQTKVTRRNNLE